MKTALLATCVLGFGGYIVSTFAEVCGTYNGTREDYQTELKLYDDSVFEYTASREFPFEVSEGNWVLHGDTVVLNSIPCKNPEQLEHKPRRTYLTFTNSLYLYKKNTLIPVRNGKQVKIEGMSREKE